MAINLPALVIGKLATARRTATLVRFPHQRRRGSSLRSQVAAAFKNIGKGVDAKIAYERTKDFYRSSGADWTRGLS